MPVRKSPPDWAKTERSAFWIEFYNESRKTWQQVDFVNCVHNAPETIAKLAPRPLRYVVAVDSQGFMKDVTRRYVAAEKYLSVRGLRVDESWWGRLMMSVKPRGSAVGHKYIPIVLFNLT